MGIRDALLNDCPEAAGKRLGRWSDGSMAGSYLDSVLPMPGLRALSGCGQGSKDYFLARGEVIPSESLQKMVFPKLEASIAEWNFSAEKDLAGKGFLNLLDWLRIVLLQDAAVLLAEVPFFNFRMDTTSIKYGPIPYSVLHCSLNLADRWNQLCRTIKNHPSCS